MDRKSVDGGADGLARGLAETIASRADRYLGVPVTKPMPFGPVAAYGWRERAAGLKRDAWSSPASVVPPPASWGSGCSPSWTITPRR